MFKVKSQHSAAAALFEGILIGGSLVALSTFLFGTKKGKEFQKEILSKYKMLGDKAGSIREEIERAVKSKASKKHKRKARTLKAKTRKAVRRVRSKGPRRRKTHRARA